ncbi:TetR family transcriptional regulator [Nocardia sp. NPDC005366]|uniref:TetR/AcrR family transcriptional regulator n=1 Tax=Nocardia sp. NPDC005366 TaxID=3156878 RepID=UPI0033BEB6B1
MPTKRELVLDGAIELLGTRGLRALTHRAVDESAAMPSGSASNYFRTRQALLIGVAERLEERDHTDWAVLSRLPAPTTVEQLVDGLALFAVHAAGADRTRTLARYALFVEAQTSPVLLESVRRGHDRLTAWAATMLDAFGAHPSVPKILVDYLDGVILHQLISPARAFDPSPALSRTVRALLA